MLHLLSVYQSPGNTPIVASFLYQNCSEYRLHVAVALTYFEGQMTYLSEPTVPNGKPVKETMTIELPTESAYRYRTMFFREHFSQGVRHSARMQLAIVSPVVVLITLKFVADEGIFCEGPADPWNHADGVGSLPLHVIYWIPCAVYTRVSPSAHRKLHAQASACPHWAFSTPRYLVHFLVHQLIEFDFAALQF